MNLTYLSIWEVAGTLVLNSLWLGAVLAIVFGILIKVFQKSTAAFRYYLSLLMLFAFAIGNLYFTYDVVHEAPKSFSENAILEDFYFSSSLHFPTNTKEENSLVAWVSTGVKLVSPYKAKIGIAWWLGICLLTFRFLGGYCFTQRLRYRQVIAVDDFWQKKLQILADVIGLKKTVCLMESYLVQSPVTLGYWRPVILLPVSLLSTIPVAQIEAVLLHELHHIKYRDYLINLLQVGIEIIFFYHPLVWWLSNVIREEREYRCDDATVTVSGDSMALARALTFIKVKISYFSLQNPIVMSFNKNNKLSSRIYRLFEPRQPFSYKVRGLLSVCLIVAVSSAFTFFNNQLPKNDPSEQQVAQPPLQEMNPFVVVPTMEKAIAKNVPAPPPVKLPSTSVPAPQPKQERDKLKIKENLRKQDPIYIKNGEKISKKEMESIAPEDIAYVKVWKSEKAIKRYGNAAKDGVILIYTKDYEGEERIIDKEDFDKILTLSAESGIKIRSTDPDRTSKTSKSNDGQLSQNKEKPLYILDGEVLETTDEEETPAEIKSLDPNAIYQISVLKDKKAIEMHGDKGIHGVIIITTKAFKKAQEKKKQ